jgi:hypothetical protein
LNCVGLFEMWSDGLFSMHGTPARPGSHSQTRISSDRVLEIY